MYTIFKLLCPPKLCQIDSHFQKVTAGSDMYNKPFGSLVVLLAGQSVSLLPQSPSTVH